MRTALEILGLLLGGIGLAAIIAVVCFLRQIKRNGWNQ